MSKEMYKIENRTHKKYIAIVSHLLKSYKIVFTPRTKEDDRRAEKMAKIVKYHLENN